MVTPDRILLSPPDVGRLEVDAVTRAVESGWVAPLGPEVEGFERDVAGYVGSSHAVALSSGTAALHLALKSVGVGAGDVVITSSMTFVATANAVSYLGATPVFVDSELDGTPSVSAIESAVGWAADEDIRVGAIVPVDIYGRAANYSEIIPLAAKFGIPVVADAAEALGATHAGVPVGSFGEASVLSFNGNKIMTTSGGGMLVTENQDLAQYVRYLASQAREPVLHYEHFEVGYNYRLSNVLAALGRAQLSRLPAMIERRREIRRMYETFFLDVPAVSMLPGDSDEDNCWLTAILVDSEAGWSTSDLQQYLEKENIESRRIWKPMHLQPLYRNAHFVGGLTAERLFKTGLVLPSGSVLTELDMGRVLDALTTFLRLH